MQSQPQSPYRLFANSLRVTEISNRIYTVKPDCSVEDFPAENDLPVVVADGERIWGYVAGTLAPKQADGIAGEIAVPIDTNLILSADTSLLDLPALFERRPYFFVLTKNVIQHYVSFRDLDKLPMQLCLFALLIELEATTLKLLTAYVDQGFPSFFEDMTANPELGSRNWLLGMERHLAALPPARLEKARETCQRKGLNPDHPKELLQSTNFIDKGIMLQDESWHLRSAAISAGV